MKKIIGFLSVAMVVATMFFTANNVNYSSSDSSSDTSLASLVNMNVANAQNEDNPPCEKIGQTVSANDWLYTPQTANCYYGECICGTSSDCSGHAYVLGGGYHMSSECTPVTCM